MSDEPEPGSPAYEAQTDAFLEAIGIDQPVPDARGWAPAQPGEPFRIESIWMFTSVNETDNAEGVVAWGDMPMIAADPERLAELRAYAEHLARHHGARIILRRFDPVDGTVELIE